MPCSSRYGNSVARTSPDQQYSRRVIGLAAQDIPDSTSGDESGVRTRRSRMTDRSRTRASTTASASSRSRRSQFARRSTSSTTWSRGCVASTSIAPAGFSPLRLSAEHELELLGLLAKVVVGALSEAATHRVIVDAEVEDLGEIGQKAVAIAAASTDEQHVWFRAFELAESLLLVPRVVERGIGVRSELPRTVGADRLVATSDQLFVDRGFTGTR